MSPSLRLLIVGGYGTFGGRIVELLAREPLLTLIVAGRSLEKAQAFCESWPNAAARLMPAAFDRDSEIAAQIAQCRPDILIDASGPFQAYGERRYRVVEACIAAHVSYLDLADGSEFVADVKAFDDQAKAAGIFVLSGASSFPVLPAAVVRRLARGWKRVDAIRAGIAPSPYAGIGENVIRAIAGYAGQTTHLKKKGEIVVGYPLTETTRYTIAPPGRLPLRNTLFSLVDVPDLRVLADIWPEARDIWMGAGPTPEVLHRLLIGLSWLVRWKLIPTLTPIAGFMHWSTGHLRWGEHRGGMFVEVAGLDENSSPATRSWHLLAEGNDGPLIPAMAVAAILKRVLAGRLPASGARPATQELELEDYEELFAGRNLFAGMRSDEPVGDGPYQQVLGSAFPQLPIQIRELHEAAAAEGQASVEQGVGWLARRICQIAGFPKATRQTPIRVTFDSAGGKEIWVRAFGADRFQSDIYAGSGRSERLLVERFGPIAFSTALVVEGSKLALKLRRWTIFGIPLPLSLGPLPEAVESVESGAFCFDIKISHPLLGLIVRYRGWLKPIATVASAPIVERTEIADLAN